MKTVFLDTSYLLSLELRQDQNHTVVNQHWLHHVTTRTKFVTTSYIFDEAVTFLNNYGAHAKAIQLGNDLLNSKKVQFIQVDELLFWAGWQYFQKHQDKTYSLTDCISFVVMHHLGITTAFTLDKHFAQAGFIKEPYLF
jgi:predicted nucleic acid-binding protein